MRIVCQQTVLMNCHALFVIFEKAAKFEIAVCCKLQGCALWANTTLLLRHLPVGFKLIVTNGSKHNNY